MPPHCDTLDGPVVKAAKRALEAQNVNLILFSHHIYAYVKAGGEHQEGGMGGHED
jgi:hypothetical protein